MSVTVTVAEIRAAFPEFESATKYPDEFIQEYINVGVDDMNMYVQLPEPKLYYLARLLIAHYIYMAKKAWSGDPESVSGVSSKTLGDASISFQSLDTNSEMEAVLSGTVYGQMFMMKLDQWRLANFPFVLI